jgi:hypothetical protein
MAEKFGELFKAQLAVLVNIVLGIELINGFFSIWAVDEIDVFEFGFRKETIVVSVPSFVDGRCIDDALDRLLELNAKK